MPVRQRPTIGCAIAGGPAVAEVPEGGAAAGSESAAAAVSPALRQLPLALRFAPGTGFDQFVTTPETAPVVHALQQWVRQEGGVFYLVGAEGSGRSHLAQAAAEAGNGWVLPLAEVGSADPAAVLEGMEQARLLCLDDIDQVAGDPAWAEALFSLFNALRDLGGALLVTARVPASVLDCPLPDLRSRLAWGGTWRLAPLDDGGRARLLRARAQSRGLLLSDDVVAYLLSRYSRRVQDLLSLVEKLDDASLVTKRRITVPLVRALADAEWQRPDASQAK